jgi:hypothetical protein
VVSTQPGYGDSPGVDFQNGLDTRLLSGTWTISATLPDDYESSIIFCTITSAIGEVSPPISETTLGQVVLELKPDETGFCNWFNVESEPRSGTALGITLLLHTCPKDFDLANGSYQTCTLPLQEPVSFEFIHNGQVVETGTATAPATELKFTANGGKPEAGEWTIRPILTENRLEPGLDCWGVDTNGTKYLDIGGFSPTDGGSGTSAKFGPNLMLQCDVWLYSNDLGKSVVVGAHVCPEDFDATNPAAGDRFTTCQETRFIAFTHTIDGGTANKGETDHNGIFLVPSQAGQWRIELGPAVEQSLTFVTCDHTMDALGQIQTIEPTINADQRSITLDLDEGDGLRCDFFLSAPLASSDPAGGDADTEEMEGETEEIDAAETDPGTAMDEDDTTDSDVSVEVGTADDLGDGDEGADEDPEDVQHWECPIPPSTVESESELLMSCETSGAGSPLTLTDNAGANEQQSNDTGAVNWIEVAPGTVTITSTASTDTGEPAVYCSSSTVLDGETVDVFPERIQLTSGAITLDVAAASEVYCDWFTFEE